MPSVERYIALLEDRPAEVQALFQDFLIRVTSFFRDPSAFAALEKNVFPALVRDRAVETPIRLWVAGCSTGEEVYSLAITLLESVGDMVSNTPIKILATDINEVALERARAGMYVDNIALDVSEERLRRFFAKVNGHYQISQAIRDLCVFSKHDLAKDPPFANMDLISCRNVLIYFDLPLQRRVIPFFHYALRPHGMLMLGTSETVGEHSPLFELSDKEHKIYAKLSAVKPRVEFPLRSVATGETELKLSTAAGTDDVRAVRLQREAERILLSRFVPPSVIVDSEIKILHFRGQIGLFLNPVTGTASLDLQKMVREELLGTLRDALERARTTRLPAKGDTHITDGGQARAVVIEVIPLQRNEDASPCFIVLFLLSGSDAAEPIARGAAELPSERTAELHKRDREIAGMREYLQSVIEENEGTSEELKAANEEILSSNEELQSTNEELQTAKEEMQSTNEELATVNDELTHRIRDLGHLNDDLINLLGGLNIPIIMVNRELLIRRFTPPAVALFNLIASDVGRPILDLQPKLKVADLGGLIHGVVHSLKPVDLEVQDDDGRWYSLRIRPYITTENRIDGAALAILDIDDLKRGAEALKVARDYANAIVDTVWKPLIVLDRDLNVNRANAAFYRMFRRTREDVVGRSFWQIDDRRWSRPELQESLPALLQHNQPIKALELELRFADDDVRTFSINGQRIFPDGTGAQMLLLSIEDVTERKLALVHSTLLVEERMARAAAETASRIKDEFLAMLAHELRNPLAPVRNTLYVLRKRFADDIVTRSAVELSERQVAHMSRLLDDLLDVSRITRGKIELRHELVELQTTVASALETCRARFDANQQVVSVTLPDEPIYLEADPARIEQILDNLLNNASKYTERGGHVWVSAELDAGFVVVRVKDNGVGIAADMLPRVFDLFSQVDRSLDRAAGGLGIGLTLVKSLVTLHNGTVEVSSPGVNRGSEFSVRLPTIAMRDWSRESKRSPSDAPGPVRRILVVDDNEDAAVTLMMALQIHQHQVQIAHEPQAALELAFASKPEVILLDIGLPGMSGYEVARRLRQDPALDRTIIIAITGYGQDEDRRRSADADIDFHLVKPVDMSVVNELLREGQRARKP